MKILVEHGALKNCGDSAMLEGVVARLSSQFQHAMLTLRTRPILETDIWNLKNIRLQTMQLDAPFGVNKLVWHPTWNRVAHLLLQQPFDARRIAVGTESGRVSLGEWCAEFDLLHIVGGGGMTDIWPSALWARCCLLHAFAALGKPVVMTGQQLGPFKSAVIRRSTQRALRRASFVGLREPTYSYEVCRGAGMATNRYAVMGDDSFGMRAAAGELVDGVLNRFGLERSRFIAANIRIGDYVPLTDRRVRLFAEVLRNLSQTYGMPVLIVPIALKEDDSDIKSGYRLAEALGGGIVRVWDDSELSPSLAKGVAGAAFGAVGVSYHFCTFALSEGVPAVCIADGEYYTQKGQGICGFWRDERLSVQLADSGEQKLVKHIMDVFDDEAFRSRLAGYAPEAVTKWGEIFDNGVLRAGDPRAA
jgi:polysaccharide pyruvyl transferase WcaK-like protein